MYSLVANHFYLLTSNLKNYLMKKPFIDFYNKYNIIPTSQNVKDVKKNVAKLLSIQEVMDKMDK